MFRIITATVIAMTVLAVSFATASAPTSSVSPDEALKKLMDGNKRFVDGQLTLAQRSTSESRKNLATSQKPSAIILTCSDSRVPPELLFDQGLGEIFVVRVAGNIPDPVILGSIEYAAEHLGSSLIVVLGHERCGAVKATVDSKGKGHGNIGAIVKTISPALKVAIKGCTACKDDRKCADTKKAEFVECVIDANVRLVAANLTKKSKVLKHLAEQKKIRIVAGKYDLDDGKVTLY